jgi:hypothetical protein
MSRAPLMMMLCNTSRGCAPRARRIPISLVRCVTAYDMTP